MRFSFVAILFFLMNTAFSQQKFSKEYNFLTDNDLYVSFEKDRYYSNGLLFSYRYLTSDFKKVEKKIIELTIGHEIYTPYKSTIFNPAQHDRPFAGYLYGKLGILKAYKNNTILHNSIQIGIVGKNAFGRELQEIIHRIYNFKSSNGWEYQIKNTFAINLDTKYFHSFGTNKSNYLDSNLVGKIRIGTIFNEATVGVMGRVGFKKLQPLQNSIAFQTHLNNKFTSYNRGIESFLYYQTTLTYVVSDATIEGSLFNNDSPVTFNPINIRFDLEVGYKFTSKKWNFGYAYHFHSNKIKNLRNNKGNEYGRLFFSYLFN